MIIGISDVSDTHITLDIIDDPVFKERIRIPIQNDIINIDENLKNKLKEIPSETYTELCNLLNEVSTIMFEYLWN